MHMRACISLNVHFHSHTLEYTKWPGMSIKHSRVNAYYDKTQFEMPNVTYYNVKVSITTLELYTLAILKVLVCFCSLQFKRLL